MLKRPSSKEVPQPDLNVLAETESLCPHCLRRVAAVRVTDGRDVFLYKECPEHGRFRTVVWRGVASYERWVRPKIPTQPPVCSTVSQDGCPFDCGLCPAHRQRSCTVLLEVTMRCNLKCPVCFADAGDPDMVDPSPAVLKARFQRIRADAGICNVQISGGEPTVRKDLPAIIESGRKAGFEFLQLNTNGIRLGIDRDYVKELKDSGLSSVFLQFDGLDDRVYQCLRGRALVDWKIKAVEHCAAHGIGVVLVPTVVPEVNLNQVGRILDFALRSMPEVRGVHFQPISYFGRFPGIPTDSDRITLPDLLAAIENQTEAKMRVSHFSPPGCENALCSFHGRFLLTAGNELRPLGEHSGLACCSEPGSAEEGARRAIESVAHHWKAPDLMASAMEMKECSCHSESAKNAPGLRQLDEFILGASTRTLSVSAMAFQDVWSLDLERVRDCCIHVAFPDGRLIPFCLRNLTGSTGQSLYSG